MPDRVCAQEKFEYEANGFSSDIAKEMARVAAQAECVRYFGA